jgi:DNA-binding HxlR family transcriptional regulator
MSPRLDLDALELASDVIGRKWTTTILFQLALEPRRFGALRRLVRGVSEKVLIQRLRELETARLVSRRVEAAVPPQVTYAMTAHGRTLCALVEAMAAWGGRHRRFLDRPARSTRDAGARSGAKGAFRARR